MSKVQLLKRKGIRIEQGEDGTVKLITRKNEELHQNDEKSKIKFIEEVLISPTNKYYKSDIGYARNLYKRMSGTNRSENVMKFFTSIDENKQKNIEEIIKKIDTVKYNKNYLKEFISNMNNARNNMQRETIFLNFTILRYCNVYDKVFNSFNHSIYNNEKHYESDQEFTNEKDRIIKLYKEIFGENNIIDIPRKKNR